jgi:hypothetical protein
VPPKKTKKSPAMQAGRKANSYLRRDRLTDQQKYESVLPEELRWSFQKGRKTIMEPLEQFGEEYIEKNIDARGANYEIKTSDPAYAISPDDDSAYAPAGYSSPGLYEAPTQTSNPDRPRTVAAAYNPSRSVLTVMFRDSTLYNYYDVDMDEWVAFRDLSSKWEYIKNVLDYKPRGPASTTDLPADMRAEAYVLARAAQIQRATAPKGKKK